MDPYYHSAEIRWFTPEITAWPQLFSWFARTGGTDPSPTTTLIRDENPRDDSYLLLPGSDSTGVKQRQGRFEIKSLVAGPRPWNFQGITGQMDQWVKWSFDPADNTFRRTLADRLDASGIWRTVTKTRHLRRFSFDTGSLQPVSLDDLPDAGCHLELTRLGVASRQPAWITLGFEAFGDPGSVMKLLEDGLPQCIDHLGLPPVPLPGNLSLSYPGWLALLELQNSAASP